VKRNKTRVAAAAFVWAFLMLAAANIRAEEKEAAPPPAKSWQAEKIEAKDVPKLLADAANKAINNGGTVTGAIKITEDGKVTYEVELKRMDHLFVVTLDPSGKKLLLIHGGAQH
jgi:hypothetical protein